VPAQDLSRDACRFWQVRSLSKILRPHLLRREKADVETLQPMQETTIQIEITNLQKVCYRAVLEHNRGLLQRGAAAVMGGAAGNAALLAGSFANVSMMLRHCCNHPWLIKEVEDGALINLEAESSVRAPRSEREYATAIRTGGLATADLCRCCSHHSTACLDCGWQARRPPLLAPAAARIPRGRRQAVRRAARQL
jgi:hypothetical protein